MAPVLHLDFETRSAADLRKVGQDVYAVHPSTDVLCAAYAFDDGPIEVWTPGEPLPVAVARHIASRGQVHAYNAAFELAIANAVCVPRYGWPVLTHHQTFCVMAMSYAMGLPGSLDNCAAALGLTEGKDQAGSRLMIQMSQPREERPDGTYTWWERPDQLERLYAYCRQDVKVEREVEKRMLPLSPYERKVWLLDWEINRRGCTVDVPAVKAAIALVESEKRRLNDEMQTLTNNAVASCTAVQQIKDFLELYGVTGDALDKAAVTGHLAGGDLHPTARRVLELRAEAGKAATAKFTPMVESAGADSRVRGCYQYSGANTRRWAGRRIQLHNLQRQKSEFETIEALIDQVTAGATAEEIAICFGPPMTLLGECTRSFLTAKPGHVLLGADFSAIEARVLAWLAGQHEVLEVFKHGRDIYKAAAASIFGCDGDQVTSEQRQVGKVAILALGYGGGVGAFQTMARGYGVKMEPAYGYLVHHASPENRIRAEATWKSNREKYDDITEKEFIASELTKIFWRQANEQIVAFWYDLEEQAIQATMRPGEKFKCATADITFKKAGSFLWCQLPSGGVICYPYPEVREVDTPWGEKKLGLTYMAEDGQSKKWMRFKTYGGSLAENITQAVSRDILADSMLRLDSAKFSIVLHTHDESVCEEPKGARSLAEMISIMTANPTWARDLPLKASGFCSFRYRK